MKLSGTRFYVLMGMGARLERALIAWMLDLKTREQGYLEVIPPLMVNSAVVTGTGHLPKFQDTMYRDIEEDYWFIPTAEVPLTNLYRDEILEAERLPIYLTAYTPCFRREKMSAGRDVRGIKRGHQFDKVEMVKLVTPESSDEELEKLVENACEVCRRLKIPFRVVQLCTADLGFQSAATYDVEMWAPGSERVAGGQLVLELHGLSAAPRQSALSPQPGRATRIRPRAQRLGPGIAAHAHRRAGELPTGRRHDSGAGSAAAVHGRSGRNPGRGIR